MPTANPSPTMRALVEQPSRYHDYPLRLSGFSDSFVKVYLINFKFF